MCSDYNELLPYFYNFQIFVFRSLGVYRLPENTSKNKKLAYELYSAVIFFFMGGCTFGLLIEFFNQPTILDKITNVFFIMISMMGALFKQCSLKINWTLFQNQVELSHKDIFTPINPFEKAIFERNLATNNRMRNTYGSVSVCAATCLVIMEQLSHPNEIAIRVYSPFELNSTLRFAGMAAYAGISIYLGCFFNIAFDSWCTSCLVFANTQLEILEHRLYSIGLDYVSDLYINADIKKAIRQHEEISQFVKDLEKAITVPVSIQIFCSISVLCCNFYALSFASLDNDMWTCIKVSIYQMAMLAQIFFFCYIANEAILTSLNLPFAIYTSNWMTWNKTNRKLIMVAIQQFQYPIVLRSMNRCYYFHLATFTSIVNTSYTYFALLKQMNN